MNAPNKLTLDEIFGFAFFVVLAFADYAYLLPWEWAHKVDNFALPAWIIYSRYLRLRRNGKMVDWVEEGRKEIATEINVATAKRPHDL
jgi:hypothetical protein